MTLSERPIANYPQTCYTKTQFHQSSFWFKQRQIARQNMIGAQLDALKKTGRYDSFKLKWHQCYNDPSSHPPVPNHLFWDSDIAKWIEGACYFLIEEDDAEMRSAVQELVQMIRSAQKPDGYLNIHFTVVEPEQRWSNLRDLHELYNLGHLIEAAIVHQKWSKGDDLIEPVLKYLDYIDSIFGPEPGKKKGYPGHPEIELALLRLHEASGNQKALSLAEFFLHERGRKDKDGRNYYDKEAAQRGERELEIPSYFPSARAYWYMQAHQPITEQETIEGHSVRAMYLLTAVADLVRIEPDQGMMKALDTLWSNMINKKMYVTGGIGAIYQWEGFGQDYFLPQSVDEGGSYGETCAGIGVMMMAQRLQQLRLHSQYADIMELVLYNNVLGSYSANGKAFTYANPLASFNPEHPSKREDWFECACCPPNVIRILGTLGGYMWDITSEQVCRIHSYSSMSIQATNDSKIEVVTEYPRDGAINLTISGEPIDLLLRLPSWSTKSYSVQGASATLQDNGYLFISQASGSVSLNLDMKIRLIYPHPRTNQNVVGLAKGPMVYCVEDVDNAWVQDDFRSTGFDAKSATFSESINKDGASVITAKSGGRVLDAASTELDGPFTSTKPIWSDPFDLTFVPYYYRANRGGNQLRTLLKKVD